MNLPLNGGHQFFHEFLSLAGHQLVPPQSLPTHLSSTSQHVVLLLLTSADFPFLLVQRHSLLDRLIKREREGIPDWSTQLVTRPQRGRLSRYLCFLDGWFAVCRRLTISLVSCLIKGWAFGRSVFLYLIATFSQRLHPFLFDCFHLPLLEWSL